VRGEIAPRKATASGDDYLIFLSNVEVNNNTQNFTPNFPYPIKMKLSILA
jgi:hypothetical protein